MLRADSDSPFAEVYSPIDASGNPIERPWASISGDHTCEFVDDRRVISDNIKCASMLIVSPRAAELFQQFRLADDTVFLPVDLVDEDGKKVDEAVAILFSKRYDVVDLEQSQYKELSKGVVWYYTAPPVINPASIRSLDLIDVEKNLHYVCSARLKDAIEGAGLTNFIFKPVFNKQ